MSNNVHILNLAAYSTPTIQESKKDAWVEYGVDNNYYSFLIDRYTNSTTNNAIINNISRLIYGRGLSALDASKKPNEYAQMMALFNKDCVRKICMDRKMLGQFAIQVHYSKDHSKILKAYHIPTNLIRAEKCNEDGNIVGYYYSDDWTDVKKFKPQRYSAFGTSKDKVEILFSKPYAVGMKYYSYPDYQGSLPYAMLEEEIADYLINDVKNAFSGRIVVNFNNGIPTEEQQNQISSKVINKLTGANGNPVIVAFNKNAESKTTIDSIPLDNAPEHFTYLSEEAMRKIMLGHNVTSPLIFGVASSNGFGSNADELRNSIILFTNMVITPMQNEILEAFDDILAFNGISLNLQFEDLNPLDSEGDLTNNEGSKVIEGINSLSPLVANKVLESMTPNEIRALVGLAPEEGGGNLKDANAFGLSAIISDEELDIYLDDLEGETLGEEWERVSAREVKDGNSSTEEWVNNSLFEKKNILEQLAAIIKSEPSRESNLDKSIYKVRYEYSERYNKANSRDFCVKMMSRTNSGVVYRLEDIDRASRAGVNEELGHQKQPYDLFKFKGGVNCSHYWSEVLYKLKKKDGKFLEDKSLSSSQEVSSIPKSYKPRPLGNIQSKIAPIDMPNKGHHPNYMK
jgi:hypothetical protein